MKTMTIKIQILIIILFISFTGGSIFAKNNHIDREQRIDLVKKIQKSKRASRFFKRYKRKNQKLYIIPVNNNNIQKDYRLIEKLKTAYKRLKSKIISYKGKKYFVLTVNEGITLKAVQTVLLKNHYTMDEVGEIK